MLFSKPNPTPLQLRSAFLLAATLFLFSGCGSSDKPADPAAAQAAAPPPVIPVLAVAEKEATTYTDYTGAIEGKVNVDIRPQVDGYLDKIFVDEGATVKAGQALFKINDRVYQEQLNTALAARQSAEAGLKTAEIEVAKITPLVQNKVVSEVQLKTAQAAYNQAKAAVAQAQSSIASAKINIGFSLIKAPINGTIGRIPKRIGNLVGKADTEPMTTLSDTREVYVYFSMSEPDFLRFNASAKGGSSAQKLQQLPQVSLILADGTTYRHKGRIQLMDGKFDKNTGSISFRAIFPNPEALLRSGNTGNIRLQQDHQKALLVPMAATMDIQDKTFVYVLKADQKLARRAIVTAGKSGNNYLVKAGLKAGEKIVYSGLDGLAEDTKIKAQSLNADSVYRAQ
jgi:membrane fusion protein (multidrug efflux system)